MKKDTLEFESLKEEREFWERHNPFEVLNKEEWKTVEPETIAVKSIYTASVGEKGAFICVPKNLLSAIDVKTGEKIKSWIEGKRLVVEAA